MFEVLKLKRLGSQKYKIVKCLNEMRKSIVFIIALILSSSIYSQEVYVKGIAFAFPAEGFFAVAALGVENKFNDRYSMGLDYQYRYEYGDNVFFRNYFHFSGRYYLAKTTGFFRNTYLGLGFRYAQLLHYTYPHKEDESRDNTQSFGVDFGKIFNLKKRFFFEVSTGPYYVYSGDKASVSHDFNNLMSSLTSSISYRLKWRTAIRFSYRIIGN